MPADKSRISPIRSAFFGELASFNKNCVPFPVALTADGKETLAVRTTTSEVGMSDQYLVRAPCAGARRTRGKVFRQGAIGAHR